MPTAQPLNAEQVESFITEGFARIDGAYMSWRANIYSKDRALLLLFLFSDVGMDDAPTHPT
jgi:hypothetical protein